MDEGEVIPLLFSGVLTAVTWVPWYWLNAKALARARRRLGGILALIAPVLCVAVFTDVLLRAGAREARQNLSVAVIYGFFGALWLMAMQRVGWYFGLVPRDDVFERGNPAAAAAFVGFMAAHCAAASGAVIGEGPSVSCDLFCALLAAAAVFAAWFLLHHVTGIAEVITVDRDLAAGVRGAGFLLGCGLIFGHAVAGDWESLPGTVKDFLKFSSPAVLLWAVAAALEPALRPTSLRPQREVFTAGLLPALLYAGIGLAVAWFFH